MILFCVLWSVKAHFTFGATHSRYYGKGCGGRTTVTVRSVGILGDGHQPNKGVHIPIMRIPY